VSKSRWPIFLTGQIDPEMARTGLKFPAPVPAIRQDPFGAQGEVSRDPSSRLYARVSTVNGQSPEPQLRDLKELAAHRSLQVVREYVDKGISGAKDSRPGLNDLMADARRKYIKAKAGSSAARTEA